MLKSHSMDNFYGCLQYSPIYIYGKDHEAVLEGESRDSELLNAVWISDSRTVAPRHSATL
jgi:hypothetical protein